MPFYTSEQILNQAFDSETGTLKTSNDQLGTPGTGEPAHAGGSTGLIGWARDILANGASILAKIATFGTSGVPSANVISVQGPPSQVVVANITTDAQTIELNCEGMTSATFYCRQSFVGIVIPEIDYSGTGNWVAVEYFFHGASLWAGAVFYGEATSTFGQFILVQTKGAKKVRLRVTAYTSGIGIYDCTATWSNYWSSVEIVGGLLPTVGTVTTPSNCSVYYTDTDTPLGANATFTGSSRTMAAGNNFFNAYFNSTNSAAAYGARIESSVDGTNWFVQEVGNSGIAYAQTPLITKRATSSYRVVFTQSATPAGATRIISSQTPN